MIYAQIREKEVEECSMKTMSTIFIPDIDMAKFDSLLQNALKTWSRKVEGGYHLSLYAPNELLAKIPNNASVSTTLISTTLN